MHAEAPHDFSVADVRVVWMGENMAHNLWVVVGRAVGLVCSMQNEDETGSVCMCPGCMDLWAYLDRARSGISTSTTSVRLSITKPCHLLMNFGFTPTSTVHLRLARVGEVVVSCLVSIVW